MKHKKQSGKKKLLLVQPKRCGLNRWPPLALEILASLTPEDRYDIEIVDEQYEKLDLSRRYDIVGITSNTITSLRAYKLADRFRSKGAKVIMGGVHATFLPEEAEKHCDSIVLNEPEEIWNNILADFENNRLKKRYHGGHVKMDNVPMLKRKFMKDRIYIAPAIQMTRGCPNHCEFCSISAFSGNKIRKKPVKQVIREIKNLTSKNYLLRKYVPLSRPFVMVFDDNLFADREYAIELFKRMEKLRIYWASQAPVRIAFDDELLDHAYKSGCRYLWLGFESLSSESLKSVKKPNRVGVYEKAISKLRKRGFFVKGMFIFGLDGDTKKVFDDTLEFSMKNNLDEVVVNILRPLPGAKLFEDMEKEGRITTYDWSKYTRCVYKPRNMSPRQLEKSVDDFYAKFFSIPSIIKRMRGLKNYRPKRLFIYLFINMMGRYKTARHAHI
ncbi:MAG: radical SAM protein [Candidatus Woesearchaeota archaeon]